MTLTAKKSTKMKMFGRQNISQCFFRRIQRLQICKIRTEVIGTSSIHHLTGSTFILHTKNKPNLFKDKHSVVEQLLKFFVCVVDTHLFKGIQLEI